MCGALKECAVLSKRHLETLKPDIATFGFSVISIAYQSLSLWMQSVQKNNKTNLEENSPDCIDYLIAIYPFLTKREGFIKGNTSRYAVYLYFMLFHI